MKQNIGLAILTAAGMSLATFAQAPMANNSNQQPTYQQPPISPTSVYQNLPVTQSAGAGGGINVQSFPGQSGVGPVQTIPYTPPRQTLSPYLNLIRGTNLGGLGAVDYYNFVRPAQQANGNYVGRTPGEYSYNQFGQQQNLDPNSQEFLSPSARPAGTPAAFMNTGGYFNRMGSIGMGARPQQQQNRGNAIPSPRR